MRLALFQLLLRFFALRQFVLQFSGAFGHQGRQLVFLQPLQLICLLDLGHGPDLRDQLDLVERLGKETFRPCFQRLDAAVTVRSGGGQEEDGNRLQALVFLQLPADGIAVHARHDNVEQDHHRILGQGYFQPLPAVKGGQESGSGQSVRHDRAQGHQVVPVIVNRQDLQVSRFH